MINDKNSYEKDAIERRIQELLRKETLLRKEMKDREFEIEMVNHELNYWKKKLKSMEPPFLSQIKKLLQFGLSIWNRMTLPIPSFLTFTESSDVKLSENEKLQVRPTIRADDDLELEENSDVQMRNLAHIEPTKSFINNLKTPICDTSGNSDDVFFSDKKATSDEVVDFAGNQMINNKIFLYPSLTFIRDVVNSYIGKQDTASEDPGDNNFLRVPKF